VDAMSEARALGCWHCGAPVKVTHLDDRLDDTHTPHIRRADRPEARVAVGESRTEVVQRMQREGGGPVTAVMVSHAGEVPEFPTTKNGISMLVNAEWHAPQCKVNRTRQYMDCDCSLSRAIAATEQEAIRRADRPEARVAVEGHAAWLALTSLHIRASFPDDICWIDHEKWPCRTIKAFETALANPAPRPPEPDRTAALVEGMDAAIHLVQQSLDTVRGEGDGESRSIKVSIAAREHVIGLLAAYRERLATQPRKPTMPLNEWEEWKRECWAAADVAAPTPDEAP
jgi:hypothetical protein